MHVTGFFRAPFPLFPAALGPPRALASLADASVSVAIRTPRTLSFIARLNGSFKTACCVRAAGRCSDNRRHQRCECRIQNAWTLPVNKPSKHIVSQNAIESRGQQDVLKPASMPFDLWPMHARTHALHHHRNCCWRRGDRSRCRRRRRGGMSRVAAIHMKQKISQRSGCGWPPTRTQRVYCVKAAMKRAAREARWTAGRMTDERCSRESRTEKWLARYFGGGTRRMRSKIRLVNEDDAH